MKQKKLVLYPKVVVAGQKFKGVKKVTVPSQSMSLAEILKRFTRKESLPVEKDGVYEDRFGDLEKLKHEDITVRHEKVEEIKSAVRAHNKRVKDKHEQEQKEKEEKEKAGKASPAPVPPDKPTT